MPRTWRSWTTTDGEGDEQETEARVARRDAGRGVLEAAGHEQLSLGKGDRRASAAHRRDPRRPARDYCGHRSATLPIFWTFGWLVAAPASRLRHRDRQGDPREDLGKDQALEGNRRRGSVTPTDRSNRSVLRHSQMAKTSRLGPA